MDGKTLQDICRLNDKTLPIGEMFEENKKLPAVRVVFVLQRAKNRGAQLKDGGRTPDTAASKIFTENGETKVGTTRRSLFHPNGQVRRGPREIE